MTDSNSPTSLSLHADNVAPQKTAPCILVVDDEPSIGDLVSGILEDEGYQTCVADSDQKALALFEERPIDAVILDIWLEGSDNDGVDLLQKFVKTKPEIPVMMISGHGTIETAITCIRHGAYDFIEKPFAAERLLVMIERALERGRLVHENSKLRQQTQDYAGEVLGASQAADTVRDRIAKAANSTSRVMITGPSGSGKEVVAQQLHSQSERHENAYVVVNCASLSTETFDRLMRGQENGAAAHKGYLERADKGTLVFDNVTDLLPAVQAKLVRLLEQETITPIDSNRNYPLTARIISLTNGHMETLIAQGAFREDLYYRLNVVPINMPSLRERVEDIPVLVEAFANEVASKQGLMPILFAEDALAILRGYHWPGNVRQLRNLVEWLMMMHSAQSGNLSPDQTYMTRHVTTKNGETIRQSVLVVHADQLPQEFRAHGSPIYFMDHGDTMLSLPLREARELFERDYLMAQISRFGGNVSKTAQEIGMERSALHRKLKSLDISADQCSQDDEAMVSMTENQAA